jgi:chromosome segregation ATPase
VEQLEKDIVLLDQKRASLEVETGALVSEQKQIEDALAPIVKEEDGLRVALKEIEAREVSAKTKEDRRKAERERWAEEQKRRTIELEKLLIREKIEKILGAMKGKETLHQSIVDEEASIKKKIHELETEQKRMELNVKLDLITHTRGDAQLKLADITKEKMHIEEFLRETEVKERAIEGSEHDTEKKMTAAKTFQEERALAEARAVLEKERHGIEEARWRAEDQADALGLSAADAEKSLEDIKKQEAELIAKLKAFK